VIGRAAMSAEAAPVEEVQFHDDPLGIGRPWEERNLDGKEPA
jgi:hypothetical protein